MADALTIVAVIRANESREADVLASLKQLVGPTRAEEGCELYDLHVDNVEAGRFLFYETWSTRELWQRHMESDHIKAHGQRTDGAVASVDIYEMSRVEP